MKSIQYICSFLFFLVLLPWHVQAYDAFTDATHWTSYDPGAQGFIGDGYVAKGFTGSVFDGTYMYFVGQTQGTNQYHGEIMRYAVDQDFETQTSWEIYSPQIDGSVSSYAEGFWGGIFDGTYIYFIPFAQDGTTKSGEVLRYDTESVFTDAASWTTFDIRSIHTDARGFVGGTFDGRYVYFTPYSGGDAPGTRYVRYDTHQDFSNALAWEIMATGVTGAQGAVFDGTYVYYSSSDDTDTRVLRYDTRASFTDPTSWQTHHLEYNTNFMVFDGAYVYFTASAQRSGDIGSRIYRYRVGTPFGTASSWEYFDTDTASTLPANTKGFYFAQFDGRYIYFAPERFGATGTHGVVLRYDTQGVFSSTYSWETFSLIDEGIIDPAHAETNWMDIGWDGRSLYFVPWVDDWTPFGEIVRFVTNYTTGRLYPRVTLSEPGVGAEHVQYTFTLRPLTPWADGSSIHLSFPEAYAGMFAGLSDTDITVEGAQIVSSTIVVDEANRALSITIFADDEETTFVGDITITIGDGVAGGIQDLENPDVSGVYAVPVGIYGPDMEKTDQGLFLVEIDNSLVVNASILQAIVMEIDKAFLRFSVDPVVNGGRDLSQYSELTVRSNAGEGYVIHGALSDGAGNARFVGNTGGTIPAGLGENTVSYVGYNDAYDSDTHETALGTHFMGSATGALLRTASNAPLGLEATTNAQKHTVYYDVNVDFLTPSGTYGGTFIYTLVPTF